MIRKLWILCSLLFWQIQLNAQINDDFQRGVVVLANGDTIQADIKQVREDRFSKSITIIRLGSNEQEKLSPKEVSYFRFGEEEYVTKVVDGKEYFLRRIIHGEASLYEFSFREKKGGKYQIITRYFVEKRTSKQWAEITAKTFKNEMSNFFSDYKSLADKITDRYYTYKEKEAVVEDYNEWVKQGKPGNTWRIEDGNFTRPENEYKEKEKVINRESRKYNSGIYGSRWGIDIPLFASYGFVSYPEQLNAAVITKSNGFGYDVGIGARVNALPTLTIRAGLHFWNKRFHSYFLAYDPNDNPPQTYQVDEFGTIHYAGIYAIADYEVNNVVVGGGFTFSFWNMYRADFRIKNSNGSLVGGDENVEESILANRFNHQFDFILHFGYKFNLLNNQLKIKPMFQYIMPMVPLFEFSNPSLQGMSVTGYLVQLGIITDIGFKVKS
ncbi:MAG: hypothetical protein N2167_03550 [Flavobacteriales bacterium]|nr:hypothetical protein [Flavobacteriales bacterium]